MDDRDGSTASPLDRLRSRFGETDDSTDDDESEESAWERFGALIQVFSFSWWQRRSAARS